MFRLLATDSGCSAVALGGLVAGTAAGVLCEITGDAAVGVGGSFLPAGALGLLSGCGWKRGEGGLGCPAAAGAVCLGRSRLTGGACASLAGGSR